MPYLLQFLTQFGMDPSTQCYQYPKYLLSSPSWPSLTIKNGHTQHLPMNSNNGIVSLTIKYLNYVWGTGNRGEKEEYVVGFFLFVFLIIKKNVITYCHMTEYEYWEDNGKQQSVFNSPAFLKKLRSTAR